MQEECWWDCQIVSNRLLHPDSFSFEAETNPLFAQAIANPECLLDCFDQNGDSKCLYNLINKLSVSTDKGTCNWDSCNEGDCSSNCNPALCLDLPGWKPLFDSCGEDDSQYGVARCGEDDTEKLLGQEEYTDAAKEEERKKCRKSLDQQPSIIKNTLLKLIQWGCSKKLWNEFEECARRGSACSAVDEPLKRRKKREAQSTTSNTTYDTPKSGGNHREPRLAPVALALVTDETKTTLNYNNTRHRYPWICSLRTIGITSEHLCAVTILSLPPQPTIIVGPAHCTYLCKDGGTSGARLDSCCCTPGPPPLGCSEDRLRCKNNPGAAEMIPEEAVILCGEWETGQTPQSFSSESYNIDLEIVEIVRHPSFDAKVGVEGGNDIAVFRVGDNPKRVDLTPICLPEPGRVEPKEGVQSGWSNPPPLYYFREFGQGFLSFVTDTYKQWHYKVKIEDTCSEPTTQELFGEEIQYPSKVNCEKENVLFFAVLKTYP